MNLTTEVYEKKQNEIKDNIARRESEIKLLEKKEQDYISGKLDEEITNQISKQTAEITKNCTKRQRGSNRLVQKVSKNDVDKGGQKPFSKFNYYNNNDRNMEKDFRYYYKQFCLADETMPDYMRQNISEMPNNKGYIWRGCWFYGHKKAQPNQGTVFFEKKHGGVMHIHEYQYGQHRVYEKTHDNRRNLIKAENLRQIRI
jgi:hypothetical protein